MQLDSRLLVVVMLVALFVAPCLNQANATNTLGMLEEGADRWDRVACLLSEKVGPGGAKSFNLATGFFVATEDGFALVTAAHAAKETNPETKVAFRNISGAVVGFVLREIQEPGKDPWRLHPSSDLAMIPIAKTRIPEPVAAVLSQIALPLETLQTGSPGRTTEIETVGFPMGVGVEAVSSIVVTGSLASDELLAKTNWGQEAVLYAAPSVGSGTSGGAVFMAHEDSKQVELVGMYIGFLSDESGSKLSKIVPARVIREFVTAGNEEQE